MEKLHEGLKALGNKSTEYDYASADAKLLERFPSPMLQTSQHMGTIAIDANEFSSLCPKTGQPDIAQIIIEYRPDNWCVESKSLKLYLGSFRQAGMFHEAIVQKICDDLVELLKPHMLSVQGQFAARGGIRFWPVARWVRNLGGLTMLPVNEGMTQ